MSETYTIKQAKHILAHILKHAPHQPVMLWGPPGVGKSQMVQQVMADAGLTLQDLRLSQMDPPDLNY